MTDIRIRTNEQGYFEVYDNDKFCACFVYPETVSEFVLELIDPARQENSLATRTIWPASCRAVAVDILRAAISKVDDNRSPALNGTGFGDGLDAAVSLIKNMISEIEATS